MRQNITFMSVEADSSGETKLRFSTTPINATTKFHTAKYSVFSKHYFYVYAQRDRYNHKGENYLIKHFGSMCCLIAECF